MASDLREKTAVVLGANGYLGRHLVHYLAETGVTVRAVDMHPDAAVDCDSYISADLTEQRALASIDWNVDYIYAFAGLTGTHAGFEDAERFVRVNEIALLNLLTTLRAAGRRPRIVFPSTRLVYEGSDSPLGEDAPKRPRTIYAVNKLACEFILDTYASAFDIPYTVYRICVPYGNAIGAGYSYGLLGAFVRQAQQSGVISLYGDGSMRRTLTHVEDICRIIIAATDSEGTAGEIFNIPGEAFSLREVAERVAHHYGARVQFNEWPAADWRIESGHTVFDAGKLQQVCSVGLHHSFEGWIRSISGQ